MDLTKPVTLMDIVIAIGFFIVLTGVGIFLVKLLRSRD
jgi:hypothetical protein